MVSTFVLKDIFDREFCESLIKKYGFENNDYQKISNELSNTFKDFIILILSENNSYSVEERNKLWKARHQAFYAVKAKYPGYKAIATDACVPISKLAGLIDETAKDISRNGIPGPIWGHVGDGNFHATLLIRKNNNEDRDIAKGIIHRMCNRCLQLEGTITGEHGIGMGKISYMQDEHGDAWEVMGDIKKTLDPNNILNPGKVIKSN